MDQIVKDGMMWFLDYSVFSWTILNKTNEVGADSYRNMRSCVDATFGEEVQSLHAVSAWVLPGYSGFLTQSKHIQEGGQVN